MPIYEYQCESCSAGLEILQKLSDQALKICPECGKDSLKKKISATSFRLKGTGWYETDFKKGNKKHGTGEKDGKSDSDKGADKPAADKGSDKKSSGENSSKTEKADSSKKSTST